MSPPLGRLRRLSGRLLTELYPEAWRERYRAEMGALIDDDPPGLRGLGSLLAGAADAHLHPGRAWRASPSPQARTRLSISGVFAAWIALSVIGMGFQKATEEASFSAAADRHPLLAIAHDAIIAGALLGAVAIALGGLPLLWQALRQARAERDVRLAGLLALPPLSILAFGGLTWLAIALAPARSGHFPLGFVLGAMAPWMLAGLACAAICGIVPRLVLARMAISAESLRRASLASLVLIGAMALVTVALAAYDVALGLHSPGLFADAGGPIAASTGATLAAGALAAALCTALAVLSATRARRAPAQRR